MNQIERAKHIKRTFGVFRAARYLRARGWTIEGALHILTNGGT